MSLLFENSFRFVGFSASYSRFWIYFEHIFSLWIVSFSPKSIGHH